MRKIIKFLSTADPSRHSMLAQGHMVSEEELAHELAEIHDRRQAGAEDMEEDVQGEEGTLEGSDDVLAESEEGGDETTGRDGEEEGKEETEVEGEADMVTDG